jgi:hypothetical protein
MNRTLVTSVALAAAVSLAPVAVHAWDSEYCIAHPEIGDCPTSIDACRIVFARYRTEVPHQSLTIEDVNTCLYYLGLTQLCASRGEQISGDGPARPDGVQPFTCYAPSPDQSVWEQFEAISAYIIQGVEQVFPYVMDAAEAIDCLSGTLPTCIEVGRKIANLAVHDSTINTGLGAISSAAGCLADDPTQCAGLVGLAAAATGLSTPVGYLARLVDGAQNCLEADPGSCLSLGVQAVAAVKSGQIPIADPDLVADANIQLTRCEDGDLPACVFLGADVAHQTELAQQTKNLVSGASDAVDCLNGDVGACARLAAHAADQSALGSFGGDLGACVVNGTLDACTRLAGKAAQAAGAGPGNTLDDLAQLASEANGCTEGDVVGCASLGAHAAEALDLRGPVVDLDADASRISRCGHADPAACVGFGAEIAAREKAAGRPLNIDTIHCRLRDGDSPIACAFLGLAAAQASDQVAPYSTAALCIAEGIPPAVSSATTGMNQISIIPTTTLSVNLNEIGFAGLLSTSSSNVSTGATSVSNVASPGPAGWNQVYYNYGHNCEQLGQALAGIAGPLESAALTAQLNAAVTAQLSASAASTAISPTSPSIAPISISTGGASRQTRAAQLQ